MSQHRRSASDLRGASKPTSSIPPIPSSSSSSTTAAASAPSTPTARNPSLLPRPQSILAEGESSTTPPVTPIRRATEGAPAAAIKTPRASGLGQGGFTLGGGNSRPLARPSPPSGGRNSPAFRRTGSDLRASPSPGNRAFPPSPVTPLQHRGGRGDAGAPKSRLPTMAADRVSTSSDTVRAPVWLSLGDSEGEAAFRKAWTRFDPNDLGSILLSQYIGFCRHLEEVAGCPTYSILASANERDIAGFAGMGKDHSLDQKAVADLFETMGGGKFFPKLNEAIEKRGTKRQTGARRQTIDTIRSVPPSYRPTSRQASVNRGHSGNKSSLPGSRPLRPDLGEEDALAHSLYGDSYQDESTAGLDLPSTAPIRGTTPPPGSGQDFNPVDDSSLYEAADIEVSVLLSDTPGTPTQASRRPAEEIARVYAEVRRLQRLIHEKDSLIHDLRETSDEACRQTMLAEARVEAAHADANTELEALRKSLKLAREEVSEFREREKDTSIQDREWGAQMAERDHEIKRLKDELDRTRLSISRDTKKGKEANDRITAVEGLLEAERQRSQKLEARLHIESGSLARMKEDDAKREGELVRMAEELKAKCVENEELQETIATMQQDAESYTRSSSRARSDPGRVKNVDVDSLELDFQALGDLNLEALMEGGGSTMSSPPHTAEIMPRKQRHGSSPLVPAREGPLVIPGLDPYGLISTIPGLDEKHKLDRMVSMFWQGREVQTEIEIPPGEARPVASCVAWLEDPTIAAIHELRLGADDFGRNTDEHVCQTTETWPTITTVLVPPTPEEITQRAAEWFEAEKVSAEKLAAEMIAAAKQAALAAAKDNSQQTDPEPPALSAQPPLPEDAYQETIVTDEVTRKRLALLSQQQLLTAEDTAFVETFIDTQTSEILSNIWCLTFPAARAFLKATSRRGKMFSAHPISGPFGAFIWPWQTLWDATHNIEDTIPTTTIATTDEVASALQRRRRSQLLQARPKPAAAWGVLTCVLYVIVFALLIGNVRMYVSMKREQNMWARANEPAPGYGKWAGAGMGHCWRICANDGWGWRWRAYIREWFLENGGGTWPS